MSAATALSQDVGKKPACEALGMPRATFYRHACRAEASQTGDTCRPIPPLALNPVERQEVTAILTSERFQDKAPYEVYATLLDEGQYHCSIRTMYRILETNSAVKERRRGHQRSHYSKPELLATRPNQVWSWDITKLKGPAKWTHFYLYVIMDIFSRYVVGWMVAHREQDALARRLIEQSCVKQNIQPGHLSVHADRGSSMKSKAVAHLLADLGVTKSHSRPHVSNDNPYSESQFKTLKYCPEFPERFGCIQDARTFGHRFFNCYNEEHRHSGIALMTPEQVHYGKAMQITALRAQVLSAAFQSNPLRFKGRAPKPFVLPEAAWINKPSAQNIGV